jgi:hypothetical protein
VSVLWYRYRVLQSCGSREVPLPRPAIVLEPGGIGAIGTLDLKPYGDLGGGCVLRVIDGGGCSMVYGGSVA